MAEYLKGECAREVMVRKAIDATRQLAKRQLTWLRQEVGATWLGEGQAACDRAVALIRAFLDCRGFDEV
jgi:tRNA A37 N6-isopentenylltransferase MiaA